MNINFNFDLIITKEVSKRKKPLSKKDFNGGVLSIYENLTKLECLLVAADVALEKFKGEQYLHSLSVSLVRKIEQLQGEKSKVVVKKMITKSELDHEQARLAMAIS